MGIKKVGIGKLGTYIYVHRVNYCVLPVQDTSSMKDWSLHHVNQTLFSTGKLLQDFASEDKVRCLTTYCDCMNIISWLTENTKGSPLNCIQHTFCTFLNYLTLMPSDVTDLQNFVTVALNNASVGEDTLTNAKLASLRTVGSGYGCLIYDLRKNADFHTFARQCKLLWEGLSHTPNLPQYLVITVVQ